MLHVTFDNTVQNYISQICIRSLLYAKSIYLIENGKYRSSKRATPIRNNLQYFRLLKLELAINRGDHIESQKKTHLKKVYNCTYLAPSGCRESN